MKSSVNLLLLFGLFSTFLILTVESAEEKGLVESILAIFTGESEDEVDDQNIDVKGTANIKCGVDCKKLVVNDKVIMENGQFVTNSETLPSPSAPSAVTAVPSGSSSSSSVTTASTTASEDEEEEDDEDSTTKKK